MPNPYALERNYEVVGESGTEEKTEVIPISPNENASRKLLGEVGLTISKMPITISLACSIAPHVAGLQGNSEDGWGWYSVVGELYHHVSDKHRETRKIRGIAFESRIPRRALALADMIANTDWQSSEVDRKDLISVLSYLGAEPVERR